MLYLANACGLEVVGFNLQFMFVCFGYKNPNCKHFFPHRLFCTLDTRQSISSFSPSVLLIAGDAPHTTVEHGASPSSFHSILLRNPFLTLRPVAAALRAALYHLLNSDFCNFMKV
ncbi:hypothetical protein PIB30_022204 [Stylosanthes scabra]|uniref:Uncharacterized protein n=1 Tax=Stylosanthes scabra TaxID=79078 RepID=A0ABU6Y9K9_9FABA|nr:hypothetical protein [Stylosanthes scabra]